MHEMLEAKLKRFEELERLLVDPEVLQDSAKLVDVAREHGSIAKLATCYRNFKKLNQQILEANDMLTGSDPEMRELAEMELPELKAERERLWEELLDLTIGGEDANRTRIMLEIRAGTGGDEAALFARDLYDMYKHYAEKKGWKVEIMDMNATELGGFKEIVLGIEGEGVFRELQHSMEREKPLWAVAAHRRKSGHPALLSAACRPRGTEFQGEGGLRAAMEATAPLMVEAGDGEMNMDADRPEDLAAVREVAMARLGLSDERCYMLWDRAGTPEHVRRHCTAVAELAEAMARDLIDAGGAMDTLLCRSAGLLHDMMRTVPQHAMEAEKVLREMGFDRLAGTVGSHMSFRGLPEEFSEETVVCLADKLVREDCRVSPQDRYAPALEKHPAGTPAGERIREDMRRAERLCDSFFLLTGKRLY